MRQMLEDEWTAWCASCRRTVAHAWSEDEVRERWRAHWSAEHGPVLAS